MATLPPGFPLLLAPKVADPIPDTSIGATTATAHDLDTIEAAAARVTSSTPQSVPGNGGVRADNVFGWDTVDYDPLGFFNPLRPVRLTIPPLADGLYVATIAFAYAATAAIDHTEEVGIFWQPANGNGYFIAVDTDPAPNNRLAPEQGIFVLSSPARLMRGGDYVWAYGWQTSAAAIASASTILQEHSFSLYRVGRVPPRAGTLNALTGNQINALTGTALNLLQGG